MLTTPPRDRELTPNEVDFVLTNEHVRNVDARADRLRLTLCTGHVIEILGRVGIELDSPVAWLVYREMKP